MEEIEKFLCVSSGSGSGDGDGYGSGSGDGYGSGDGDGYGDGYGYGSGYGSGDGDGYGYGSGYGSGSGSGSGYGDGYGSGSGDGDGSGYGSGSGSGDGYGDGYGISEINGQKVYMIDDTPTTIDLAHVNYAKGNILNTDLTLTPCYIAKIGNFFAHGETLHDAMDSAVEKYEQNLPVEERIKRFNEQYPDRNKKIPAKELFNWHHVLTGSCLMGRKEFCRNNGIDYENGEFTVNEFIAITEDAYGKEVIKKLNDNKTK